MAKDVKSPQRIPNRREMLKLFPIGGVYAELGVFRGMFSERILETCAPKRLFLVDLWTQAVDWLIDGQLVKFSGEEAYSFTCRLEAWGSVRIRRQKTVDFLIGLPDASLDVAYLDADHSYNAVRDELALVLPRMRKGGWISGHDYCDLFPGVVRAVTEFTKLHGLKLDVLTDESPGGVINCPTGPTEMAYNSFAIKVL